MLCGCTFMSLSIKKTKAPSFYTPKIEESDDIFFEQKKTQNAHAFSYLRTTI